MFQLFLASRARRVADKLPMALRRKLYGELKLLAADPFQHRKVKKMHGSRRGYRLRLGRWRILFAVFRKEKRIEVVDIFLRKEKNDYGKKKFS